MAGLTVDNGVSSGEVLLDDLANVLITTSLTTGAWGTYSVRSGVDVGWTLTGPSNSPTALVVSGAGNAPEDKTWTPEYPGRYLVSFQGFDGVDQVTLTAVYEVGAADGSQALPAPQEAAEVDAVGGWWVSIEERLRALGRGVMGVAEMAYVSASSIVPAGDPVVVTSALKWRAGGAVTDLAVAVPGAFLYECAPLAAIPAATSTIALLIEPLTVGGKALAVVSGLVPYDTSTYSAGDKLYISDAGAIDTAAGATERVLGIVEIVGPGLMSAASFGVLRVTGAPPVASSGGGGGSATTYSGNGPTVEGDLVFDTGDATLDDATHEVHITNSIDSSDRMINSKSESVTLGVVTCSGVYDAPGFHRNWRSTDSWKMIVVPK
jgi:hypothetical protein